MTSIKVKFRTSGTTDKEGTIYYQLTHNRQVRQIVSNYRISSDDWTGSRFPLKEDVNADIERIGRIIRLLDEKGDYTADDVVDEYRKYQFAGSLFNYIESLIDTLRKRNKIRTAETYHATLNSLKKYFNGKDIMIDRISSDTVEAYEVFLQNRGLTPNTTSFYMRIFRAVYNRAISESKIERRNPFKYVYTGIEKTIKRALPVNVMRKIKNLDLSDMPSADFARDMFMLSFYLRGMSFVDMAFLRKSDLSYGYVTYRRRKLVNL